MEVPKGYVRGFYHLKSAWYAAANMSVEDKLVDAIEIGLYTEQETGTKGEFSLRFVTLQGEVALELRAFHDSWFVLNQYFGDLLARLGAMKNPVSLDGEAMCKVLLELGLKDLTPRQAPAR